jgi:hypothetical protein
MPSRDHERENLQNRLEREARVVRTIQEDIDRHRKAAEQDGRTFTALTETQLAKKLRSVNSPIITWQSWGSTAAPGSLIGYSVGISNPDPVDVIQLFGHLFVGPANIAPDVSEAISAVDTRFPRLTMPQVPGLTVKAGATEQLDFSIDIPVSLEKSNYMGNTILFQSTWHDPAVYLDRSLFVFQVA